MRQPWIIQKISERIKEISENRSIWLALTGSKQPVYFNGETNSNEIKATQDKVLESLKNASPEQVAELQREQEKATNQLLESLKNASPELLANIPSHSELRADINSKSNKVQEGLEAIGQSNKSTQEKLGGELSELKNRLEDPSLTQEQRQSDERRIEKIEKAIELLKKIENDKDFQAKIWSKLSKEQQESILEDIKDGELTEESLQAINRATAAAEVAVYQTQTINEGFFALSKQRMREVTGLTHEEYHAKYKVQMNLENSEFIKTNIELKVYSRDSSYDSSSYSSNVTKKNENDSPNSNLSPEQKVANMILELQSRGALTLAEQSLTNKDIAQKLGLKPNHPIVLAIAGGEYDLAWKLSIGLNVEASINAIAPENAIANKGLDDEWLSISNTVIPTEESNSFNLQVSRDLFNLTFV
jgi:hypothetical protein